MSASTIDDEAFTEVARDFEHWLAAQATAGVSELVLVGLLRGYADTIEEFGYIPREWHQPSARNEPTESRSAPERR